MYAETTHWDQDLKMCVLSCHLAATIVLSFMYSNSAGHLSSIISIEIKSGADNNPESRSIARADTSVGNLLEICADGDGESRSYSCLSERS